MCNGNCNQGRMCDCVPNVEDQAERASPSEFATLIVIALLSAFVMVTGACTIAFYLWDLSR